MDNVCVRCGKKRVEKKTWKEVINGIVLTHTQTACPDPKCQAIVDKQFAIVKSQKAALEEAKIQRTIAKKIDDQILLKTSK